MTETSLIQWGSVIILSLVYMFAIKLSLFQSLAFYPLFSMDSIHFQYDTKPSKKQRNPMSNRHSMTTPIHSLPITTTIQLIQSIEYSIPWSLPPSLPISHFIPPHCGPAVHTLHFVRSSDRVPSTVHLGPHPSSPHHTPLHHLVPPQYVIQSVTPPLRISSKCAIPFPNPSSPILTIEEVTPQRVPIPPTVPFLNFEWMHSPKSRQPAMSCPLCISITKNRVSTIRITFITINWNSTMTMNMTQTLLISMKRMTTK